jgi:hypothetical protein
VTTVTEHDIDRCVFELSSAQQKKSGLSHRLTFRSGQLIRDERINGLGVLQDDDRRVAVSDFEYRGEVLSQLVERSRNGVLRGSVRFSRQGQQVAWLDEQGRPRAFADTRATGFSRTFDAAGHVTSYTYVDTQGTPAATPWGYHQVRLKRDANGVIVEQAYFTGQGEPTHDSSGVHREEYLVDQRGLTIGVSYYDDALRPVANFAGVHHVLNAYDEVGNLIERSYYDLAGKLTVSSEEGAAGYRVQRDAHGSETARAYYGLDGKLTWSSYGYAILETKRDARGDIVEWNAYDTVGVAAPFEPDDYTSRRVKRDARGNVVQELFFDGLGRPALRDPGYHGLLHEYDARDNVTLTRYVGLQREKIQPAVVAFWTKQYEGDRLIGEKYFALGGEPTEVGWGYTEQRRSFDNLGIASPWQYFDARGTLLTEPNLP